MKRALKTPPPPGFPCKFCAVRPDIDCDHRPADPTWWMRPPPPETDGRRLAPSALKNARWSLT